MKLLFVRHAIALEREEFLKSNDLKRPLSDEGRRKAHGVFSILARFYQKPLCIVTSEAARAIETAEILNDAYGGDIETFKTALLNPGAGIEEFKEALIPLYDEDGCVAVVGHEPDFSFIISQLISGDEVALSIKKASVIEVEIDRYFNGELKFMIPPKIFNFLKKLFKGQNL